MMMNMPSLLVVVVTVLAYSVRADGLYAVKDEEVARRRLGPRSESNRLYPYGDDYRPRYERESNSSKSASMSFSKSSKTKGSKDSMMSSSRTSKTSKSISKESSMSSKTMKGSRSSKTSKSISKESSMSSKSSKRSKRASESKRSSKQSKSKDSKSSKAKETKGSKTRHHVYGGIDENLDGDYKISVESEALENSPLVDSSKRTEEADKAAVDSGNFLIISQVQAWLLLGAVILATLMCKPCGTFMRSTQEPVYAPLPVSSRRK